MMAASDSFTGG